MHATLTFFLQLVHQVRRFVRLRFGDSIGHCNKCSSSAMVTQTSCLVLKTRWVAVQFYEVMLKVFHFDLNIFWF